MILPFKTWCGLWQNGTCQIQCVWRAALVLCWHLLSWRLRGRNMNTACLCNLRFADSPLLAYVNVAGISVSGGVEANFNVDYARSRQVVADYDRQMNYTQVRAPLALITVQWW